MASLIWIFSSVCPYMYFYVTFLDKTFITMAACILFHPYVCSMVCYHLSVTVKKNITMAALIRFSPSVYFLQYYQTTLMGKTFVTKAALIWFLISVSSGVILDYFKGYIICHNCFIGMVNHQCLYPGVILYNISCQNIVKMADLI